VALSSFEFLVEMLLPWGWGLSFIQAMNFNSSEFVMKKVAIHGVPIVLKNSVKSD
jgi:hypothetical protein